MSPKLATQRASEILVPVVKRERLPRVHRITRSFENCCGIRRCDPHWMSIPRRSRRPNMQRRQQCCHWVFRLKLFSGEFACAHGIWEHQNLGTIRSDMWLRFVSNEVRRHRLISISYISLLPCHGRGRRFESLRPGHIRNDLQRLWQSTEETKGTLSGSSSVFRPSRGTARAVGFLGS